MHTSVRGATPLSIGFALVISAVAFYFLGIGFPNLIAAERLLTALLFFALLYAHARRGWESFYIALLSAASLFVSLSISFGAAVESDGPLTVALVLPPWVIYAFTIIVTLGLTELYRRSGKDNRFPALLFWLFAFNWCVLAFNVKFFEDWKLENYLTVPFAVIIYFTHRTFRFSNLSYGLIFAYMMFHIVGSHYTYAEVPFGFWMRDAFDIARNHYDRIVHFFFGFLLAYPLREAAVRITSAKGVWGFYIPIEFVLAFSAIYEIIEWIIAVMFGGDLGIAYLGTQGDVWDAIKDMALAGGGAAIAMTIVFLVRLIYDKGSFIRECKESLRVKDKRTMGESALETLRRS